MRLFLDAVAVVFCSFFVLQRSTGTSMGNGLTRNVCTQHGMHHWCWDPRFMDPANYTSFWVHFGHKIANVAARKRRSGYNVVHLRCGDTLHLRHPIYTVPCISCLDRELAWLNSSMRVDFIVGGHKEHNARGMCTALVDLYMQALLRRIPRYLITLHMYERSAEADWLALRDAQRVLALSPSSFVFSARGGNFRHLRMLSSFDTSAPWFRMCVTRPGFTSPSALLAC